MAQQKVHKFRQDKPVPWSGRKRVKKKKQVRPETTPDGWQHAMAVRYTG